MLILSWCKLQLGCLLVMLFTGIVYIRKGSELNRLTGKDNCRLSFDIMYIVAEIAVLFDGVTACSVNYAALVPYSVNLLLHCGMYLSYEGFIAMMFFYWWEVAVGGGGSTAKKLALFSPLLVCVIGSVLFLPRTAFLHGAYTDYSMGPSVYFCFACIVIYSVMTLSLLIARHSNIQSRKLKSMSGALACIIILLALQIIFPEYLLSSIAVTLITVSLYINMENPDMRELEHYHRSMITGFATLVDNKDDSTGGHIIRSSAYAVLIAQNLRRNRELHHLITGDFLNNLNLAAPMHDIGKIGIPDAILQKPGKLTAEEFDKMKEHPVIGAAIIRQTFSNLGRSDYENMAYEIALYHHEKWNGRGYPEGLSGTDIPLSARIMAVADVFDAVSAKRCYRDAMPLEECYNIIRNGRGTDFDPDIVDAFMLEPAGIEEIYHNQHAR